MRANVYIKTVERDETKRTLYIYTTTLSPASYVVRLSTTFDSCFQSARYLLMSGVQLSYDNCVWSFLRNTALAVSLIV